MAEPATYIDEAPDAFEPPDCQIQWRHYDALSAIVGDAVIAAAKATDFRERAFWLHREQTLDEILVFLAAQLPSKRGASTPSGEEKP